MAIAIVVLQTGERVITDLQEVREENKEDGKPICLMFVRPYNLNVESTDQAVVNQEVQVRFSKWLPYSSDTQFKIPFVSVMAVGTADPGLSQAYAQTVEQAVAAEQAATKQQAVPAAAATGVVPAGTGFQGNPEEQGLTAGGVFMDDPNYIPQEEYQDPNQHDNSIPGIQYPEDGTTPDGGVDPDFENLSDEPHDKVTTT
jgi:hypothetical protein